MFKTEVDVPTGEVKQVPLTQAELNAQKAYLESPEYAARLAERTIADKDETYRQTSRADGLINYLVNHSPAEIAAKIDADVTSVATAKIVLKALAIAVSVLAKKEFR